MDPPRSRPEPEERLVGDGGGAQGRRVRHVKNVTCGQCGWPSACVAQDGMRVLTFVCHWCGKTTVGIVDPTIKRTIIF